MLYYVILCYVMLRYGTVWYVMYVCVYIVYLYTHIYDYIHTMSLAVAESMGDVSLSLPFSSTWKGDH